MEVAEEDRDLLHLHLLLKMLHAYATHGPRHKDHASWEILMEPHLFRIIEVNRQLIFSKKDQGAMLPAVGT